MQLLERGRHREAKVSDPGTSLDGETIRDAILKMELNTVLGAFKVDADGFQIAHRMVIFQWQDGKKVIVWPAELAPGKARFPTPPWNQRR
jgi:branched-chain amino acid transport system substrate-binding protein